MKLHDKSRKTFIAALERLLVQIRVNESEIPDLGPSKVRLGQLVEQVKLAARRQQILTQDSQLATQEMNEKLGEARDLVSRIESLIRATLGSRDPRLSLFGIAIRGRRRPAVKPGGVKKGAPPATTSRR